jgi:hypothetical protein
MAKANLEKAHKRYKDFVDKSWWKVNFEEGDEVWLNIKIFQLSEGLSHKLWGPYAGPFKVLKNKFFDIYKYIPYFMFRFWRRFPIMLQGLIESTTQGPHPTSFIMNENLKWRLYWSQTN